MKYNDNGEWKDVQIKVANAIKNEYGESNNDGYSQNYLNDKLVNVEQYSTTEQRIGTWIDGKPLYRKVVSLGTLPNATGKRVTHNISNIDIITNVRGISTVNSWNAFVPLPLAVVDNVTGNIQLIANKTEVIINTGSNRTSWTENYAILEYTKTTDV